MTTRSDGVAPPLQGKPRQRQQAGRTGALPVVGGNRGKDPATMAP